MEHHTDTAEALHHIEMPTERTLMVMHATLPALVLGSTQVASVVDTASLRAAEVQLARRRSGGGAVLLVPGEHVWIDLVVPAGDPLWVDDVEASSWWVGDAFANALAARFGIVARVHRGTVSDRQLGRLVCFAATGPGEVTVGDRKLVGLSQRRTRDGARFQCVVHRRFDPAVTLSMLVADAAAQPALRAALRGGVTDLARSGAEVGWGVVEDLLDQLP